MCFYHAEMFFFGSLLTKLAGTAARTAACASGVGPSHPEDKTDQPPMKPRESALHFRATQAAAGLWPRQSARAGRIAFSARNGLPTNSMYRLMYRVLNSIPMSFKIHPARPQEGVYCRIPRSTPWSSPAMPRNTLTPARSVQREQKVLVHWFFTTHVYISSWGLVAHNPLVKCARPKAQNQFEMRATSYLQALEVCFFLPILASASLGEFIPCTNGINKSIY